MMPMSQLFYLIAENVDRYQVAQDPEPADARLKIYPKIIFFLRKLFE
jgi:hypothetical protein